MESSIFSGLKSWNLVRKLDHFGIVFGMVFWLMWHFKSYRELPVVPWFQRLEFLINIFVHNFPWTSTGNYQSSSFLDLQKVQFVNMDALFHQGNWKWNQDPCIEKSLFGYFHPAWVFEAASWLLETAGMKSMASCSWVCMFVGCSCK